MNLPVCLLESSFVGALVNFQESDAPPVNAEVPRELREAEVLRPGTYTDMSGQRVSFTVDDLHEYARNFDPADPPPIQLDHSKSARDTQGYVRALRVTDNRLLALTEFLGTYAVEQVRAGLWRKLSGGMYLNPRRMKELTVTPFPAVGTARLLREETENPAEPGDGGAEMDEETKNPTEEAVENPAEKPEEEAAEEPVENSETPKGSRLAALAESNPEAAAILQEHEQKIARLEAENQRQAQVIQLREDTAQVETWLSEGKSVPAMSKLELEFLSGLNATQRQAYAALKQASPAYVHLGRKSRPSTNPEGKPNLEHEVANLREVANEVRKTAKV